MNIIEKKQLERYILSLVDIDIEKAMTIYIRNAGNLLPNRNMNKVINLYNEFKRNKVIDKADIDIKEAIILYHQYKINDNTLLMDMLDILEQQDIEEIEKTKNRTQALKLYIIKRINIPRILLKLI